MKTIVLCLLFVVSCTVDKQVQDDTDAAVEVAPHPANCPTPIDAGVDAPVPDAAPPTLQSCAGMGCDGTQNVPLYCPGMKSNGQPDPTAPCFCAAPSGPDGWCFRP